VRGKVIEDYGLHTHPKFGTSTRNNGIDIQAPAGTPVRAVADGFVDYRDWLTGYGNCVILNHGKSYYTLYAHLSDVAVSTGQTVAGGDVIGTVGDTGSLKGPMLHFEVRHAASAVDPRAGCADAGNASGPPAAGQADRHPHTGSQLSAGPRVDRLTPPALQPAVARRRRIG